jgi:hypothetical protein
VSKKVFYSSFLDGGGFSLSIRGSHRSAASWGATGALGVTWASQGVLGERMGRRQRPPTEVERDSSGHTKTVRRSYRQPRGRWRRRFRRQERH